MNHFVQTFLIYCIQSFCQSVASDLGLANETQVRKGEIQKNSIPFIGIHSKECLKEKVDK